MVEIWSKFNPMEMNITLKITEIELFLTKMVKQPKYHYSFQF